MIHRSSILLWSVVALFVAVYVTSAAHLVAAGLLGIDYFSLLFESDPSRVIENSTSFWGDQARTRVHPLHIVVVAPFGVVLERLLGSADWAAVVITALFAGGVMVNVAKVLERLGLSLSERLLFVVLLAGSASHVTFGGPVPETHIMSAFFMSAAVRCLSPERLERLSQSGHSVWTWLRDGGAAALAAACGAVGMLLTHIVTMPVYGYLLLGRGQPRRRRRWFSLLVAAGIAATVFALHVGQRVVFPPVRGAAPTSLPSFLVNDPNTKHTIAHWKTEDSAGFRGKIDYVLHSLRSNLAWTTSLTSIPMRVPHVVNTALVNSIFAPEFEVRHYSWRPAPLVTFEPWSSNHRAVGGVGAIAWLGMIGASVAACWGKIRSLLQTPALAFTVATFVYSVVLFTVYGDEIFLFSPNWVFALIILAGAFYAEAGRIKPRWRPGLRGALWLAAGCLVINSALYFSELMFVY